MRIKIDKADKLFSIYIRTKANWTCQRCGKKYPEGSRGLHNSHFWGRGRENTRYDEINCDAICFGCHQYFGANPAEYAEWKKKRLGEKKYDKLMLRAHTYCKKDRKLALFKTKLLLEKLKSLSEQ